MSAAWIVLIIRLVITLVICLVVTPGPTQTPSNVLRLSQGSVGVDGGVPRKRFGCPSRCSSDIPAKPCRRKHREDRLGDDDAGAAVRFFLAVRHNPGSDFLVGVLASSVSEMAVGACRLAAMS